MTAGRGGQGVKRLSKKEKMGNNVHVVVWVIAQGEGIRGLNVM